MKHTILAIVAFATLSFGQSQYMTLLSPDSGSTNMRTDSLTLIWESLPNVREYSYHVARNGIISTHSGTITDTFATVSGLFGNTLYSWSVTAYFNDGTAALTEFVWHFTTGDNPPPPVSMISPIGNVEMGIQPELVWSQSSGATGYEVQISDDTGFTNLIINEDVGLDTFFTTTDLSDLIQYYWRVRAYNNTSPNNWSMRWSFKLANPGRTSTVYPAYGDSVEMNDSLIWTTSSGALYYYLQVSSSENFSSPINITITAPDTSVVISSLNGIQHNTSYYWRVNGSGTSGFGSYSDTGSFSIGLEPLSIPSPVAPPNETVDVEITDTLRWSTTNGDGYIVEIADNADFTSSEEKSVTDTLLALEDLTIERGVTYFWRVKSYRDTDTSDYSAAVSFTTQQPTSIMPRVNIVKSNVQPKVWVVDMMGRKITQTNRLRNENLPKGCYILMGRNRTVTKNMLVK